MKHHRWLSVVAVGLLLAGGSVIARKQVDAKAEVFRLQLQRFEGSFSSSGGRLTAKMDGDALQLSGDLDGLGPIKASALYRSADRKGVSSLSVSGLSGDGLSSVENRELILEVKQGNEGRRLRLRLKGKDEIELAVLRLTNGTEATLATVVARRSDA